MRKLISIMMATLLALSLVVPASATGNMNTLATDNVVLNETSPIYMPTYESAMPILQDSALLQNTIIATSTLSIPARAAWAVETEALLESAYGQTVINVSEDTDYIVFEYDYDESKLEDGQLLLTKYLKPESALAATASVNTKLNYAWGWSEGYHYKNDQKTALYEAAANNVFGYLLNIFDEASESIPLISIFSTAISMMEANAEYSRAMKATDWVKFYYCNKIGCVQDTVFGYWLPYAYVGERRGFNKIETIIYDDAGQPHTVAITEETGIPSNNPTNSPKIQKKNHYDDDNWIINKAVLQYTNDDGVYSDIYEVVGHITDIMP